MRHRCVVAMPSVRLLLVRHAQHDISIDDGQLTTLGWEQARALARAIPLRATDALTSSPSLRARATAGLFRSRFEILEGLEEFRFGVGATDIQERVAERTDLALWRADDGFPGGETLRAFHGRVTETLESLASGRFGTTVVAVTHAGFIDASLRWAYGLKADDDWLAEAELPNASITEIEHWNEGRHRDGAPRFSLVHRIGDVAHLPSKLVTEI